MLNVLEWFLFGMFVWGCCIVMQALQNRIAPETGESCGPRRKRRRKRKARRERAAADDTADNVFTGEDPRDREIRELRERLQVLEAIVTDRRFQWEQDFQSGRPQTK